MRFSPTRLGPVTEGSFERYFDGDDLYVSTTGDFRVDGGLKGNDEDVFVCHGFGPGGSSDCDDIDLALGGSRIRLTRSGEDVDALALTADGSATLLSTTGDFSVPVAAGEDGDLFGCPGAIGNCEAAMAGDDGFPVFEGDDHTILGNDIESVETDFSPLLDSLD